MKLVIKNKKIKNHLNKNKHQAKKNKNQFYHKFHCKKGRNNKIN